MVLQLCIVEGIYQVEWPTTEKQSLMKSQKVPETSRTNRAYAQGALNLPFPPVITTDSPHAPAANVSVRKARGFCTEACRRCLVCFFILQNKGSFLLGFGVCHWEWLT